MPVSRTNPETLFEPNNNAYSQVVAASGTKHVYVSGTTAKTSEGKLVGVDDMRTQIETTLDNVEASLAAEGATLADVVRIRIFTRDVDRYLRAAYPEWPASKGTSDVDEPSVMEEYFGAENLPASTLVGVNDLADAITGVADGEPTDVEPKYLVEIDVTAVVDESTA